MDTFLYTLTTLVMTTSLTAGLNPFTSPGLIVMESTSDSTVFSKFNYNMDSTNHLAEYPDRMFTSLSVYPLGQTCVLVDRTHKTICKITYANELWNQPECVETFGTINGLDIDNVRGLVFWTDPDYNAIIMARISNLTDHHVIVDTLVDRPGGIAVHPEAGLLFWTDFGTLPKVERSTLTGRDRRTLMIGGSPYMLTIDRAGNRLFWINSGSNTIESCDTTGERRYPMFVNIDRSTASFVWSSMVVYQSRLLLSWRDNSRAGALSLGLGAESQQLRSLSTSFSDISIVREQPQLQGMEAECVDCFCRLRSTYNNGSLTTECASEYSSHGYVFYTTTRGLYRMDSYHLTTSQLPQATLIYGANLSVFTTDPVNEKLFAYSYESEAIIEVTQDSLTGNWITRDLIMTPAPVKSIAVDWMSRNIYWIEHGSEHISVANYEGKYRKWLMAQVWADDIKVDPHNRRLFWLNSSLGLIEGANLDGNGQFRIGYTNRQFTALTIDCAAQRLITFDFRSRELVSIDYLNSSPPDVIRQGFWHVTFMAMIKDYVVVSNDSRYLTLVNTRTGIPLETRYVADSAIIHMEINHVDNVINTSPCMEANGGCEQLCLPNPSTRSCRCGFGYHESSIDNGCSTRFMSNSFLLVVDQIAPAIYQYYDDPQRQVIDRYTIIPAVGLKQPYAVAYDDRAQFIYWSDIQQNSVSRIHKDGHSQEIVLGDQYLYVLDMTISVSTRWLFISDYSRNRIIALNVNTLRTTTFSGPVNRVYGLSLDQANRYMYATGYGTTPNLVRIDMYTGMPSTDRLPSLVLPGKIVAHDTGIYLIEQYLRLIIRIDRTGNQEDIHQFQDGHEVQFITADTIYLYWTERNTKMIYRLNLQTRTISQIGLQGMLVRPAGLTYFGLRRTYPDVICPSPCSGTCSTAGDAPTSCDGRTTLGNTINLPYSDICIVPHDTDIIFGKVTHLRPGSRVPEGSVFRVQCLPAHSVIGTNTAVCRNRSWNNIPRCQPDNKIFGSRNGGWTIFTQSGNFYVYSWMTTIKVLVIGGGGGGYQSSDQTNSAGNGQGSRFGNVRSLIATAGGGYGGSYASGGAGGMGERTSGSAGRFAYDTCSRGGSVWNNVPIKTHSLFCANDYGPNNCFSETAYNNISTRIRRDCRIDTACKYFGDGAESLRGGSGGGGGYSRPSRSVSAYRKTLIPIEVGLGGSPSYGTPGGGVVIIWWGWNEELSDVETAEIESLCYQSPNIEP